MKMKGTGMVSGNGDEQRTLVVVFLRGGADGLTLAPPVGDRGYYAARPTLAVKESDILKLGDANCGLNPLMDDDEYIGGYGLNGCMLACVIGAMMWAVIIIVSVATWRWLS